MSKEDKGIWDLTQSLKQSEKALDNSFLMSKQSHYMDGDSWSLKN